MDLQSAHAIVVQLARGHDPATGQPFGTGHPVLGAQAAQALETAGQALGRLVRRRPPPPQAGRRWSPGDDAALRSGYAAGQDARALAAGLGRTRGAVESRLVRLGAITLPPP